MQLSVLIEPNTIILRKGNYVNVCQGRARQTADDLKQRSEPKKQPQVKKIQRGFIRLSQIVFLLKEHLKRLIKRKTRCVLKAGQS